MPYLEFLRDASEKTLVIQGTYHPILVGLSVVVAVVAAYASLGFAGSLRTVEERRRRFGLLAAGTDFSMQRTLGVETAQILHFASALWTKEVRLSNSGASTQAG